MALNMRLAARSVRRGSDGTHRVGRGHVPKCPVQTESQGLLTGGFSSCNLDASRVRFSSLSKGSP